MSHVIHLGDARDVLATLESGSARTCICSPPYYGLRDYGTAVWEGGDAGCDHVDGPGRRDIGREIPGSNGARHHDVPSVLFRDVCGKCGARRVDRQIGLEASLAEYVAALVAVFHEVRRILTPDGTLWLNLGDSYASSGLAGEQSSTSRLGVGCDGSIRMAGGKPGPNPKMKGQSFGRAPTPPGLGPKQLLGVPWRVAFALQDDGWILRSDIIWAKPNPMPESVRDRPTKAHEYVFLLEQVAPVFLRQ